MKIVSYDANSVTFETSHNSLYVVGESSGETNTIAVIGSICIVIAILISVMFTMVDSRKTKA